MVLHNKRNKTCQQLFSTSLISYNSNNNLLELEKKDTIKNNFKSITNHFLMQYYIFLNQT